MTLSFFERKARLWHPLSMQVPPSKSHSMRALLFEFLSNKECQLKNLLHAPEVLAFKKTLDDWDNLSFVDVKNSGLALHFLIALASIREKRTVLTGDQSIRTLRPIASLVEALKQSGAKIRYLEKEGYAPIEIEGPIWASTVEVDGVNSQFVSALLIAFSQVEGTSKIIVKNPCEKPYVAMTLAWLERFHFEFERKDFSEFVLKGPLKVEPFSYTVVADFSSFAFLFAVERIFDIPLDHSFLDFEDLQGDKELFHFVQQQSCSIEDTPDLLPILMVMGCYGKGPLKIHKIGVARSKESDRPLVMQKELEKMGGKIRIDLDLDFLEITPCPLHGAFLDAHHDHRVAMSLAVAAIGASGESVINGVECVRKSFPNFFETFCPDRIAQVRKNDLGQVFIRPVWSEVYRS